MLQAPVSYKRHRPEETPLYRIVSEHLESFLAFVTDQYERRLPRYVENEFRSYVECGILAHGFSRARCAGCGHEILVAFSCKLRGICPSCNARRMCDTAAHLIDHVLPDVRLRQWVLSVPFEMRILLAANPRALSAVGRIFCQEICRWQQAQALVLGHQRARGGVICFPQRFGGSLNLNVHYHVVAPDAAFAKNGDGVELIELGAPTHEDLDEVALNTATRVFSWLQRRGFLGESGVAETPSPLLRCLQGSLGVGDLHADGVRKVGASAAPDAFKAKKGLVGQYGHFNIHAGVSIGAGVPQEQERLLRYCARAPLSLERLRILDDGRIAYQVKHAYRGRPAMRIMTPMQFMARLAALIPPPRHPLIRFHGVFAPNSKWRSAVVPQRTCPARAASCSAELSSSEAEPRDAPQQRPPAASVQKAAASNALRPSSTLLHAEHADQRRYVSRIDWATLLRRVYNIDALQCPQCGGRLRFTDLIEDKAVARAVLQATGFPSEPPPLARARAPDWQDN